MEEPFPTETPIPSLPPTTSVELATISEQLSGLQATLWMIFMIIALYCGYALADRMVKRK